MLQAVMVRGVRPNRFPGAMQHAVLLRRTGNVSNAGGRDGPGSAQQRRRSCASLALLRARDT